MNSQMFNIVSGQMGPRMASMMKFAQNKSVGDKYEDLNSFGGDFVYFETSTQIEILSSDENDTALGDGARTVTVYSLSGGYNLQKETVVLNGTTPVTLSLSAIRVWRARVCLAGDTGGSIGIITVRGINGGLNQIRIDNGQDKPNQSLTSLFTIPLGYFGLICGVFVGVKKLDDAEAVFQIRPFGEVFQTKHPLMVYQEYKHHAYPLPTKAPPKSDIRIRGRKTGGSGGSVSLVGGYSIALISEELISLMPDLDD